jgi:hypothetical protein
MTDLFIDVLPAERGSRIEYKVILIGFTNGAAPQIPRISAESLLERFQQVLLWPERTTDGLRDKLARDGRLTSERLEFPTKDQLTDLGFEGL